MCCGGCGFRRCGCVVAGVMVVVSPGVVVTGVVDSCGVVFRDDCSCGCRCYGCG